MLLGRVVGSLVATRKDPRLEGNTLLVVQPVKPDGEADGNYVVAVDSVGAGRGELVLTVSGSSARMAEGCKDKPVDCVIVGIVDTVSVDGDR
jgi:microcompartment protein CcmK/EutM